MVDMFSWLVPVEERVCSDDSVNFCCYLLGAEGVSFIDLAVGCE